MADMVHPPFFLCALPFAVVARLLMGTTLACLVPNAWDFCLIRLGFLSHTLGISVPNAWDFCPKRLGFLSQTLGTVVSYGWDSCLIRVGRGVLILIILNSGGGVNFFLLLGEFFLAFG